MGHLQKITKLPTKDSRNACSHGSPSPGPWPVTSTEPVSMGKTIGKRGQNNRWLAYPTLPPTKDTPRRSGACAAVAS